MFREPFPSFPDSPAIRRPATVDTRPARGVCEVVVFTRDSNASLGSLPLAQIELLLEVWAERYCELGAREDVAYVFAFENRGVEVGVTLHHPHGQIYAYPFVPPIPARELENQQAYLSAHGRGLLESVIDSEVACGKRMLYAGPEAVAFVPVYARYPYEVWVAPRRVLPSVADLNDSARSGVARALKTVLLKFDGLWARPFPYVMAFHQAPTDGRPHPEAHLHIEFYRRTACRPFEVPRGSEMARAGSGGQDPDEKAAELRAVEVARE